jgi:WD40 repeat protein
MPEKLQAPFANCSTCPSVLFKCAQLTQVSHTLLFPREDITALCCFGDTVASGTSAGVLHLHSCVTAALQQSLKLPRSTPVSSLVLPHCPAGSSPIVLAASFSRVLAYSCDYGTLFAEFEPHADSITAMSCSQRGGVDGGILYTTSEDTTIRGWAIAQDRSPWVSLTPPLFEIDSPEASVPTCLQVLCLFA